MPRTQFDLSGRTVLITGASSGLGARFAQQFAAAGAKVVAAARRLDRLNELAGSIRKEGGKIKPIQMDVGSESSIKAGFDAAEQEFGLIDTVIANAGINIAASALELEADGLDQMLNINVRAVFLTARECARRLIAANAAEGGRIILVGSVGSLRPLAGLTLYATTKAAVAMLGKSLAREWARYGINVNTICPGWIETEINSEWLASEAGQKMIKTLPRRRLMKESDLDGIVLFLASDAAAAITGGVFATDDGQALT